MLISELGIWRAVINYYYFDSIIKIEEFDVNNTSINEKSYEIC